MCEEVEEVELESDEDMGYVVVGTQLGIYVVWGVKNLLLMKMSF